jgi:hypothetical protein
MASNNAINLNSTGIIGYDGTSTFNGSSVTQHSILLGGSNVHTINNLGVATNGQLPIGSTSADPVLATLTAGTGVTITNGAGSITINASGGGLTWNDVTGTSATGAANNGYIADNAGLVTVSLPATAAQGTIFAVVGGNSGSGGWKISQASGQQINFGTSTTTSGTGGSLASTKQYDCVFLLCTTANTNFIVYDSIGNITVV